MVGGCVCSNCADTGIMFVDSDGVGYECSHFSKGVKAPLRERGDILHVVRYKGLALPKEEISYSRWREEKQAQVMTA